MDGCKFGLGEGENLTSENACTGESWRILPSLFKEYLWDDEAIGFGPIQNFLLEVEHGIPSINKIGSLAGASLDQVSFLLTKYGSIHTAAYNSLHLLSPTLATQPRFLLNQRQDSQPRLQEIQSRNRHATISIAVGP